MKGLNRENKHCKNWKKKSKFLKRSNNIKENNLKGKSKNKRKE